MFMLFPRFLLKLLYTPPNTLPRTIVTAIVSATKPKVHVRMIFFRMLMRTFHRITIGKHMTWFNQRCDLELKTGLLTQSI